MHHPARRRPLAAISLASFALFWVATIAEAWCPMHAGRAVAAVESAHAEHGPEVPSGSGGCHCPGDCGGAATIAPVARVKVIGVDILAFDVPAPLARDTLASGRPQLRLPFATAPPVA